MDPKPLFLPPECELPYPLLLLLLMLILMLLLLADDCVCMICSELRERGWDDIEGDDAEVVAERVLDTED
jgi:hypothetical protein